MPLNGGIIQADATITQNASRTETAFAQGLRAQAIENDQRYSVSVASASNVTTETILDTPALYQTLADNIVSLARTRFDAPWDGVILELGYPSAPYEAAWESLLSVLSTTIRGAGVLLGFYFVAYDPALHPYKASVLNTVADWVEFSTYFGAPAQRYYLEQEWMASYMGSVLEGSKFHGTLGNYCEVDGPGAAYSTPTYTQALQIIADDGKALSWVESDGGNIWRLWRAILTDTSIVYVYDIDTLRHRLRLLSGLGIERASLFQPGYGDPNEWSVLLQWKAGLL